MEFTIEPERVDLHWRNVAILPWISCAKKEKPKWPFLRLIYTYCQLVRFCEWHFDVFHVVCKQLYINVPFLNGTKNWDFDDTCKQSLSNLNEAHKPHRKYMLSRSRFRAVWMDP